jgi:hydroxymethylglutaryl-CoA synthase
LVQKSFGRLAYNDFKRDPTNERFADLAHLDAVSVQDSYTNKEIEKSFMNLTKMEFAKKVTPSLIAAKNMGNMYCGSLYGGLASLLSAVPPQELVIEMK